jgi:hypothetical protein
MIRGGKTAAHSGADWWFWVHVNPELQHAANEMCGSLADSHCLLHDVWPNTLPENCFAGRVHERKTNLIDPTVSHRQPFPMLTGVLLGPDTVLLSSGGRM